MSLIDREKLIEEYDRVHVGPAGKARRLMEDAEDVRAIEVDWIERYIFDAQRSGDYMTASGAQMMLDIYNRSHQCEDSCPIVFD